MLRMRPSSLLASEAELGSGLKAEAKVITSAKRHLSIKRTAVYTSFASELDLFLASVREDHGRASLNVSAIVKVVTDMAFKNAGTHARVETDTNIQFRVDVPICAAESVSQGVRQRLHQKQDA